MSERSSVKKDTALQPFSSEFADQLVQKTSADAGPHCPSEVLVKFFTEFLHLEESALRISATFVTRTNAGCNLSHDRERARTANRTAPRDAVIRPKLGDHMP